MKCPKCGSHKLKYIVNRTKVLTQKKHAVKERRCTQRRKRSQRFSGETFKKITEPRTDFRAKCKKCGWEGEIKQ